MSEKNINFLVQPGGQLQGSLNIPGDKSISHRTIMLGSLANGVSHVDGFLEGEDCLATLKAFRQMGVNIEGPSQGKLVIHGVGLRGLKQPDQPIDVSNSGTSIRLMSGILAGQSFDSELMGDESLSKRPMKRVTDPLELMGANIISSDIGTPPLKISGKQELVGINYRLPMPSAQVKSCVLLAGLYAKGETTVVETELTRDHTERMLQGFGYPLQIGKMSVSLQGGGELLAQDITVPSDISSAAFFLVGASIAPNSELLLPNIGINPTRVGVINILKAMGADIVLSNQHSEGSEPVADIKIRTAKLHGIHIPQDQVALAIDEFPAIFIAAACAEGETVLTGASELRVKESDRIQAMADGLLHLGIDAKATPDGMIIQGGQLQGGEVDSYGDHRIAMAFAMAALRSRGAIKINNCTNVATSFPDFVNLVNNSGMSLVVETH